MTTIQSARVRLSESRRRAKGDHAIPNGYISKEAYNALQEIQEELHWSKADVMAWALCVAKKYLYGEL